MVGVVRLTKLAKAANSTLQQDHMLMYIDRSVAADVKLTKASKRIFYDLTQVCSEMPTFIEELKRLKCSAATMQNVAFLKDIRRRDIEKSTGLMIMVNKTQF
nr:hypothetical protein [Tanacetum cinerariifolium]